MGQTNQESITDLGFLPCEPFLPGGNHGVRILAKSAPSGVLSVKTVFLLALLYHKVKTKTTTRIHKKWKRTRTQEWLKKPRHLDEEAKLKPKRKQ